MGSVIPLQEQPPLRRPSGLTKECSDLDLTKAVKAYLSGASQEALADLLHVPVPTVRHWTDTREFRALVTEELTDTRLIIKGQLTRLSTKALAELDDRLQNGDDHYTLMGEYLGKRPLKAKDISDIARTVLDQQRQLEKAIGIVADDTGKISLEKLAKALKKAAEDSEIDVTPTRVD